MSRILVIDDDPTFAKVLLTQIESFEFDTESAGSIEEGVDLVESFAPELVFLDVNLPDGSGIDAIKAIKEKPSSPEVIIVTGEGETGGAALAIRYGAWDYLQKGLSVQDLMVPVKHALEFRKERLATQRTRELDLEGIIGRSPQMQHCYEQLAQSSAGEVNVLVTGETGTGKELFARAIHNNSRRSQGPFVVVDCAALPDKLVESLLFGHAKGAFTGADTDQVGLVTQADGGTLFLDEVGELPMTIQKAFLRVLQERTYRPVGSQAEVSSDFRLVSATNRDLDEMVAEGSFRKDLLYRLKAEIIHLPPLKDRGGDAIGIAKKQIANICKIRNIEPKTGSQPFFEALQDYHWPGNVRELVHVMQHAITAGENHKVLHPMHIPTNVREKIASASVKEELNTQVARESNLTSLKDAKKNAERQYLLDLMTSAKGDIDAACELAGVSRARLYALLKEHRIRRS